MKALIVLLLLSTAACSTMSSKMTDPNNRTDSQHVLDDRQCSRYHYDLGHRYLDGEYWRSCMENLGYKQEWKKGTDYILFTSWE